MRVTVLCVLCVCVCECIHLYSGFTASSHVVVVAEVDAMCRAEPQQTGASHCLVCVYVCVCECMHMYMSFTGAPRCHVQSRAATDWCD